MDGDIKIQQHSDCNDSYENNDAEDSDESESTVPPPARKSKKQTSSKKGHTQNKKSTDLERLECDICGKKMYKHHRMLAHLREHRGLNPFSCDECGVSYRKWGTLKHHNDIHHDASGKFEKFACDQEGCTRTYNLKHSLSVHIRRTHQGEPIRRGPRPMCDTCGKTFRTNFFLTVSKVKIKQFSVVIVNGYSRFVSVHQEHMYIHQGVDSYPYACEICNKRFVSKYQMKIHIMRHNKIRNHECPICGKRTTTAKEMKIHVAYHEKNVPYPCETCGRVFQSKGSYFFFIFM